MKLVPDTSVVIDGHVSAALDEGRYPEAVVCVPEAVVAELETQANDGVDSGWDGLSELQALIEREEDGAIELRYVGKRPTAVERGHASEGEVDAIIRDVAEELEATFLTSDVVQAEVARAKGLTVDYVSPKRRRVGTPGIEEYFDDETMSVHLKTGAVPMAKRGTLGEMHYGPIAEEPVDEETVDEYAREVLDAARESGEGFLEFSEPGMQIVQLEEYRIAIARPPFADGIEITAVRPIAQTDIEDYDHADELKSRLLEAQRGVLISGAPGAGKSTFAQSVARFLAANDYAVKTMEKPRDLQVGPEITQYTELGGDMATTADALLMVRPDYTVYDEVRKTGDFEVFADMRLAGVGMVGVVHATRPIDALQRLIGRVELGVIPQVVDTVVFIEAGGVDTVYDVRTEVKVPAGLMEEDLARPVILVTDFETGRPAYEIYTFNRQVVTVPIDEDAPEPEAGVDRIARDEIEREIRSIATGHVDVELRGRNGAVVYVDEDEISGVIGKGGGRISSIEDRLGIDIDVRTHGERSTEPATTEPATTPVEGQRVEPDVTGRHVVLPVDDHDGETVEIRAGEEYLFTATVSRGGEIQVSRGSAIAEELERAIDRNEPIRVTPP